MHTMVRTTQMQRHTRLTTHCLMHARTRRLPCISSRQACNSKVAFHFIKQGYLT